MTKDIWDDTWMSPQQLINQTHTVEDQRFNNMQNLIDQILKERDNETPSE